MPKASKSGVRGLYRGADGRYRIDLRWKAPDGTPRRHKEKLPPGVPAAAAKKRAQDVLAAALGGTLGATKGPRTLRKAFDEYLEWVEGAGAPRYVDPAREKKDKSIHADAWIDAVGDVALGSLGVATFDRFIKHETGRGVGPATINRRLTTMKHMLARAAGWGWVERAKALDLRAELKLLPEPDRHDRVRWLSAKERRALESKMSAAVRAIYECASLTGLRLGSIVGMLKSDVDLSARMLTVAAKRKGVRARLPVRISPPLVKVLRAAMARSQTEHVFVSTRGRPFKPRVLSGLFGRIARDAGVKGFSFHGLRHDAASRMRRAGVPIEDVQAVLGHSDVRVTQRYAHIGRDALDRAMVALTIAPSMPPARKAASRRSTKS